MSRFVIALFLFLLLLSCSETDEFSEVSSGPDTLIVNALPDSPLDVALRFSNSLGMNDPECFEYLEEDYRDSLMSLELPPWELFGRWRGFDSGGRLTETILGEDSLNRTSYYCTIARLEELPPVIRFDFVLQEGKWLIEDIISRLPSDVLDSLSVETSAMLVMQNPIIKREMRIARMLLDDCELDYSRNWASWIAASAGGADFSDYIMELSDESYSVLALSNIRIAAKLQIVQDRATFQVTDVPIELRELVAAWRELAYLKKAVLRANHEAMQNLRQTGTFMPTDTEEEVNRIAFLENAFYSVDAIIESNDTLSSVYPVLLTFGDSEPLEQMLIHLDPHQLEQKTENDIGVPLWRALGVDMNGDLDPERILYWAGDLYLFLGTPTGYSLAWRSWLDFNSDFHGQFGTQTSPTGCRSIVFVGNTGYYEYELFLDELNNPIFNRTAIAADTSSALSDELVESPLLRGENI